MQRTLDILRRLQALAAARRQSIERGEIRVESGERTPPDERQVELQELFKRKLPTETH
jgi:hypothetical protein